MSMSTITRTTAQPTFRNYQVVAFNQFKSMGFDTRSALFNATYYAAHKTKKVAVDA